MLAEILFISLAALLLLGCPIAISLLVSSTIAIIFVDGMPPMNFINSTLAIKDGRVTISFNDVTITLPDKYAVPEVMAYDGKEVIMGVRPEALNDESRFVAENSETSFPAHVDVVEMLGAETYLYLTVADVVTLTARVDPTVSHSKVGEVTTLAIDGNRVHLFDKETELVILS